MSNPIPYSKLMENYDFSENNLTERHSSVLIIRYRVQLTQYLLGKI